MAIILSSAFYFGKYLSIQNIMGITIASCGMRYSLSKTPIGVLSYNVAIRYDDKKKKDDEGGSDNVPVISLGIQPQNSFSLSNKIDKYTV